MQLIRFLEWMKMEGGLIASDSRVTLANSASGARLRGGYKNQGYRDPHRMCDGRGNF